MQDKEVELMVKELPKEMKKKVADYIEHLIYMQSERDRKKPFNFSWEGAISGELDDLSSVELQHKSMDWR